jgi:hypothetical protein
MRNAPKILDQPRPTREQVRDMEREWFVALEVGGSSLRAAAPFVPVVRQMDPRVAQTNG